MEQIIVNIGSSSKKYTLYINGVKDTSWGFEKISGAFKLTKVNSERTEEYVDALVFEHAIDRVLSDCKQRGIETINEIAVRTVAPGDYFAQHRVVDDEFMQKFALQEFLAPLHIHPTRNELSLIREALPNAKIVAASDTAFHFGKPKIAKQYGLPKDLVNEYGFYRYGYHGHSISSIWNRLTENVDSNIVSKTIVLHLGSGSSITAILDGKTADTSMGFSPLEGLMMSTRSGTIDPSVIFALISSGKTREEIEKILNKDSGLLGVSGESSDMRDIIRLAGEGHENASLALDLFVYNVIKTVGSYVAVLGGLDSIVFTAAIGEGAPVVRKKIIDSLSAFGLTLDEDENNKLVGLGGEPVFSTISADSSKTKIFVIQTNESESILNAISNHV